MNEENVINIYHGIIFRHKKQNPVTCDNVYETGDHLVKQSGKGRLTHDVISYVDSGTVASDK